MKRMHQALPAVLLFAASACQSAGTIEGEAPHSSAAGDTTDGLKPLLAPGASTIVPFEGDAQNIDELRVWPVPAGGHVVQLASVLFSGTVSTCATHALVCSDGTTKAFTFLVPGKPSHLPMTAAGSGSKLLMGLPGRSGALFDTQACTGAETPDLATLVPEGSSHLLGSALLPDQFVVVSSTVGNLHVSMLQVANGTLQVASSLGTIDVAEAYAEFPVYAREYATGKVEVLYRNSYGGLFYARNDGAAPLPVIGLHWPDIAGAQIPVYRDDVRPTDSGALLISVDDATRLDQQTSNRIWKWDPATPASPATQVASAPEPPSGFSAWQHAYGWGAAIAEKSIPNPDDANQKVPTGYTARTLLSDVQYATADLALTPCAVDSECRKWGESTLLGVAGWGDKKVGFYRVWAWREERKPEAGASSWLRAIYAVPVK